MTPPQGVRAFLKPFGTRSQLINVLRVSGITATVPKINTWVKADELPDHVYETLRLLIVEDAQTEVASGFVEVYFKGVPIGQLYLHRNITLLIRRNRKK